MTKALIAGGYILLARKLLESGIMGMPHLFLKVWIYCLLNAVWKDHGNLKRGQLFTSIDRMRNALSYKVGYRLVRPTVKEIRVAYEFLAKGTMIGITKVTRGMIITVLNYDYYQDFHNYEGHNEGHAEGTSEGTLIKKERENEGNLFRQDSLEVLAYLNEATGKKYRDASFIAARLKDGGSVEDCRRIIDTKLKDPYFQENPKYLNPRTLFRPSHWDQYLNEGLQSDNLDQWVMK